SDSMDRKRIEELSQLLKQKNIPHNIIKDNNRLFILLGEFYENKILYMRQKNLFRKKIYALNIQTEMSKINSVYALELSRPPVEGGFTAKVKDFLRNQRYESRFLNESAYFAEKPLNWSNWSKIRNFLHLSTFNQYNKWEWKISFRLLYDATFDTEDSLSNVIKDNQQFNFIPEETYWKYIEKDWQLELGFLNVKWGNLIDTYIADIVNPKDMRDFILPRDSSRDRPFLGLRFNLNFEPHNIEFLYLPVASVDYIGRHGTPFYPISSNSYSPHDINDRLPAELPNDMGYGLRWSVNENPMGGSLFYLRSVNNEARFERTLITNPNSPSGTTASLRQKHFPITKFGGTFNFAIEKYKIHLESLYVQGDKVPTTLTSVADGLVDKNSFHMGLQIHPQIWSSTHLTLQYVIKSYLDYTDNLMVDENEQFATIELEHFFHNSRFLPKITAHFGTQRGDSLIRPQVKWVPTPNLNLKLGYDLFEGDHTGTFGKYSDLDRYYLETEYSF
ncbi:MAG: hypothetical protein KDD58_13215, partial [Bdellovibrionales bacterium]|nr:hypothetical protein [Bdellovibrionales bacterium]